MDSYRNIVMFGNARWRKDTCGNSAQQLGFAFLQLGYSLLYITPNATAPVTLRDYSRSFRNISLSKNLLKDVRKILKEWSASPQNTIFISSVPNKTSAELMKFFYESKYAVVYRHVDWFDQFSHQDFHFDPMSLSLAARVSRLITISHPELIRQFPDVSKPIITQTNGVDLELFSATQGQSRNPADLVGGKITIGFWGTYWGNCIDWPLVHFLASRNSDWSFNFIADLLYLDTDRASLPANVHLLGLKKKTELPAYIRCFDLCFIPFRTDQAFAKYANPIKALESVAALKPVVTPPNTSLKCYPAVFVYTSKDEAEMKIREAVFSKPDHTAMVNFAKENTWQKKAITILQELKRA